MPSPHLNRAGFEKRRAAFEAWIVARGAELLTPTSEWELCRFRTEKGTAIVYTNKAGVLNWTGESGAAYLAFQSNGSWRAGDATKRRLKSTPACQALRQRDGDACFFCHLPVEVEDESPEHLVAITHGGPDHIANMALAHKMCNAAAGHLPLMEKLRIRESAALVLRMRQDGLSVDMTAMRATEQREDATIHDLFDRSDWPPPQAEAVLRAPEAFDPGPLMARLEQVRDNPNHDTIPPWDPT